MVTITTIKEVSNVRYIVKLVKLVNPTYGIYYSIHTKRIGKNARWYNSQFYEFTEISALRSFQRQVAKVHRLSY